MSVLTQFYGGGAGAGDGQSNATASNPTSSDLPASIGINIQDSSRGQDTFTTMAIAAGYYRDLEIHTTPINGDTGSSGGIASIYFYDFTNITNLSHACCNYANGASCALQFRRSASSLVKVDGINLNYQDGAESALANYKIFASNNNLLTTVTSFNMAIPAATTTNVGSYGVNVNFDGCALTQASVDIILAGLVASVNNSGYATLNVQSNVNLSGGTNAAPSSAGSANASTLVSIGFTVLTN